MVTLIAKFPFSEKFLTVAVLNARQSEFSIAVVTPSWIELGEASNAKRRRFPVSSSLNLKMTFHVFSFSRELFIPF